ncbi:uncharacterized protein LOC133814862 [Humulus lupulus]|uniref:uncharacterized protein LOC133814862 n=1 Tax=Humulus lupulus TaxID=3486 RepID=UPI002B40D219|nr:uncharacterized protein LOC133814862 [Humulus lupulus]
MFKDTVLDSWNKPTIKEGLAGIIQKLYRVKHVLKKFHKKELVDIPHSYQVAKENLNMAQDDLANDPLNSVHQLAEQTKLQEFTQARTRYVSFLQQTSKITWLQFNDENSHYFHAIMKKRRAENRITSYVVNDEVIDDYDKVVEHYFNHFRNFMGKKSSTNKKIDINCLKFGEKLTIMQQVNLIRPFSKEEVKEAMFGIHSIKSPGPDGFGAGFFIGLWNEIGNDISMAVLNFFRDGLAQGLYEEKHFSKMLMKIDLSKAYDTVDWQFVGDLLKGLCFPLRFIHWVLVCLKGTSYSLMLNSRLHGTFRGGKGSSTRRSDISSLVYDLVIFCKGNEESMSLTQSAINSFCDTTGLSINNTKSHIYFGGINDDCKTQLLEIAQMEEGSFPLKYLGVHLRPTKWRAADCGGIIDKIQRNLHSWASKNLSFAGRAQLIHSVLLGIRNFWMSIFILPQKVVAAIDKSCRDFLWGLKGNRSKLHSLLGNKFVFPKSMEELASLKYFRKFLKLRNVIDCAAVTSSGLRASNVQYASAIWHHLCVSKHRFISWKAMNDHLLTRDHLGKIMELASYYFPVCESVIETHQHLFFYFTFTKKILQDVSSWSGFSGWPSNIEA